MAGQQSENKHAAWLQPWHLVTFVGALVGAFVGAAVGMAIGVAVGAFVGAAVGEAVGAAVGIAVGTFVGAAVGIVVGTAVGAAVGEAVGIAVGPAVGATGDGAPGAIAAGVRLTPTTTGSWSELRNGPVQENTTVTSGNCELMSAACSGSILLQQQQQQQQQKCRWTYAIYAKQGAHQGCTAWHPVLPCGRRPADGRIRERHEHAQHHWRVHLRQP